MHPAKRMRFEKLLLRAQAGNESRAVLGTLKPRILGDDGEEPVVQMREKGELEPELVLMNVDRLVALKARFAVRLADRLPGVLHHEVLRTRVDGFDRVGCARGDAGAQENARVVDGKRFDRIVAEPILQNGAQALPALGHSGVVCRFGYLNRAKRRHERLVDLDHIEAAQKPVEVAAPLEKRLEIFAVLAVHFVLDPFFACLICRWCRLPDWGLRPVCCAADAP